MYFQLHYRPGVFLPDRNNCSHCFLREYILFFGCYKNCGDGHGFIASDNDWGTMEWKFIIVLTILLISSVSMAGCTGPSPAPVAAPAPVPASTTVPTPASVSWAAPTTTWPTLETPATGHPYSKTYSFHGSGTYEDFTFTTTSDATWAFQMDPGPGYFLVILKDAQGKQLEVLADGAAAGTKSAWLKAGDYAFDITAESPWDITMSTS
jgi:hypothetical protein